VLALNAANATNCAHAASNSARSAEAHGRSGFATGIRTSSRANCSAASSAVRPLPCAICSTPNTTTRAARRTHFAAALPAVGSGPMTIDASACKAHSPLRLPREISSARYLVEQGVPPLSLDWAVSVAASPLNAVAISEGRVVATTSGTSTTTRESVLAVLDVQTGGLTWSTELGDGTTASAASVVDGRVYVADGRGSVTASTPSQLRAFELDDGELVWATPVASQWATDLAPVVSSSAVYAHGGPSRGLYGLSRATGRQLFMNSELPQEDAWVAALYGDALYTYVRGILRRHDVRTGEVTSSIQAASMTYSASRGPVFSADGKVYLVAEANLYAFALADSRLLWKASLGRGLELPALAGSLVLAQDAARLTAFDADTGEVVWRALNTDTLSLKAPVVAAGFAYVQSAAATYAIDLRDGSVAWQTDTTGALSIAAGRLFVASSSGLLYAYKLTPRP
jgi:outer membrane protein assembly factor BamB